MIVNVTVTHEQPACGVEQLLDQWQQTRMCQLMRPKPHHLMQLQQGADQCRIVSESGNTGPRLPVGGGPQQSLAGPVVVQHALHRGSTGVHQLRLTQHQTRTHQRDRGPTGVLRDQLVIPFRRSPRLLQRPQVLNHGLNIAATLSTSGSTRVFTTRDIDTPTGRKQRAPRLPDLNSTVRKLH